MRVRFGSVNVTSERASASWEKSRPRCHANSSGVGGLPCPESGGGSAPQSSSSAKRPRSSSVCSSFWTFRWTRSGSTKRTSDGSIPSCAATSLCAWSQGFSAPSTSAAYHFGLVSRPKVDAVLSSSGYRGSQLTRSPAACSRAEGLTLTKNEPVPSARTSSLSLMLRPPLFCLARSARTTLSSQRASSTQR